MNVDMFTGGDAWDRTGPAQAKTQHQIGTAVLKIERGGNVICFFGPDSSKTAFDQIAVLWNEAHPLPTVEQVAERNAVDEDMPF